jgi:hypothetical protein
MGLPLPWLSVQRKWAGSDRTYHYWPGTNGVMVHPVVQTTEVLEESHVA